jgi:hypothetical protein
MVRSHASKWFEETIQSPLYSPNGRGRKSRNSKKAESKR